MKRFSEEPWRRTWAGRLALWLILAVWGWTANPAGAQYQVDEEGNLAPAVFDKIHDDLKKKPEGSLPLEVFLEVNIFEVLVNDTYDIGFIYDILGEVSEFRGTNLAGDPTTESDLSVLGAANRNQLLPPGANIVSTVLDDDQGQVQVVIQALAEDQILKVHANPTLLTVDGVPVSLESGEDIPYLARKNVGNVETVESKFTTTGVTLRVTPHVAYLPTDVQHLTPFVHVDINASLSSVSRFREEQGFVQPIVDTRQTSTSVWLKEKSRILIGGLFRDRLEKTERGIPLLKDIPILGRLFRSTSNNNRISHLFVMIRPSILDLWGGEIDESVFEQAKSLRELLNRRVENVGTDSDPLLDQFRNLFERTTPE